MFDIIPAISSKDSNDFGKAPKKKESFISGTKTLPRNPINFSIKLKNPL